MRKCFVGVQRWCPSTELGPTGRRFELLARGGSQGQMFDTSRPPPYTHTPPPLWSGGQEGMGWVARISPCAWASASLPCLLGLTLFLPPPQPAQFGEAAGVRRGGWQQADAGAHRGGGPHGKRLGQSAPEALAQAGSPHPRARSLAPSLPGQPLQHAGPLPRARALRPERTLRAASLFQSQASRPEQSVMQALESLTETQVSDFLSGRSPLTLALRVGDHMMFVQLQLAAQHAPLQHRHVLAAAAAAAAAARGDPSMTAPVSSPCRPVSSAARVPPMSSSPAPASPSPVTAGSFRSHSASTTCPELTGLPPPDQQMDCSPPASSGASPTSTPGGSPTSRSRKPGAVIESFVNHAPGVFSGTFSGTLHPNCQDSSGRPRRDIGTILQILNDLLSATRHYQGMPPSLTQLRCHAQCTPASPAPDLTPKTTSCDKLAATAPASLSQARMCKPLGDRLRQTENRATRCKVERLQLLLQQKRLRRKARRDARGPYHWPPSRKAGRSDTSGGGGGGGPSEASGLGLDFEESVWKPEVNPDMKSEFVVA
uniref:Midnolin n=2 Tax=Canis lupus familiaris TaxID=9615 RepID=A0A8C0NRI2_CANLF